MKYLNWRHWLEFKISIFVSRFKYDILGWNNPIMIAKEVNKHRGEMVLSPGIHDPCRLEGWVNEPEDLYYVMTSLKRGVFFDSCVGGFTVLKGKIDWHEYYKIQNTFDLNINSFMEKYKLPENML